MKKLILILSLAITAQAMAQEGKTGKENQTYPEQKENGKSITPQDQTSREFYYFKDKKLWHVKDNLTDEVKFDVTMSNGTKLTTRGEMISKTGKHEMLEEGQCVDMTATLSFCMAPPDNKNVKPGKKNESFDSLPEDKQKNINIEPGIKK
jgi:uncharacterized protein YdeI (BOF family)